MIDKQKKAMTKPIRLGLIGCGGIVRHAHQECYLALPDLVNVVAVSDPVHDKLERVGKDLDVPPAQRYADHRDLLEKANVDAVCIATPHNLHAEHAIESAKAGVAIISEKPMATSIDEADAILSEARSNNVPYTVVHNFLFSAQMQEAQAQLRDGKVGEPVLGRAQSLFDKRKRAGFPGSDWRGKRAAGGGCINDTSYHEIYSVESLMRSPIRHVEARVKTSFFEIDVDDMALLLLEHENGTLSTVSSSWCVSERDGGGRWCEVQATKGALRVKHSLGGQLQRFAMPETGWEDLDVPGLLEKKLQLKGSPGHIGFFSATFEAMANGSEMPVAGEQARHILAVIDAARRASEQRRAVDLENT